jgi:hypothetical protein
MFEVYEKKFASVCRQTIQGELEEYLPPKQDRH